MSVHKRSYKTCRDCDLGMGDTDLFLLGDHVYCAEHLAERQ